MTSKDTGSVPRSLQQPSPHLSLPSSISHVGVHIKAFAQWTSDFSSFAVCVACKEHFSPQPQVHHDTATRYATCGTAKVIGPDPPLMSAVPTCRSTAADPAPSLLFERYTDQVHLRDMVESTPLSRSMACLDAAHGSWRNHGS